MWVAIAKARGLQQIRIERLEGQTTREKKSEIAKGGKKKETEGLKEWKEGKGPNQGHKKQKL